jgi:hypothetical protein
MATAYFAANRRANDAPSPGPTPTTTATGLDSDSGMFHSPGHLLRQILNCLSFHDLVRIPSPELFCGDSGLVPAAHRFMIDHRGHHL